MIRLWLLLFLLHFWHLGIRCLLCILAMQMFLAGCGDVGLERLASWIAAAQFQKTRSRCSTVSDHGAETSALHSDSQIILHR